VGPAGPLAMATAVTQVVGHIHGLHRDFANTQAHSEWLLRFQQVPEAWSVVHELLTSQTEEVVQYFASHTIVSKLQAGQLPPDESACRRELLGYLGRFRSGPPAVRRQLLASLVDCQLWRPPGEDAQWLNDSLRHLSEGGPEAVPCLLELLAVIPEEAANRKVMVTAQRRSDFAASMLIHTSMVLEALWKAAQANEVCAIGALRACAKWLHLQHASPALRAMKKSTAGGGGGKFTADLLRQCQLHENPLLQRAAQVLSSGIGSGTSLELCRACADLLSEAVALSNEVTGPSRQVVLLVAEAVVAGSQQLLPSTQVNLVKWMDQDTELSSRVAVLGRLLSELGSTFTRLVVADGPSVPASIGGLADIARHFVELRHTDLARCGLDFWYQALSQHIGAESQEDDPFDEEALSSTAARPGAEAWAAARDPDAEAQRRTLERPLLAPHIEKMVQAHWQAVRYPPEPEQEEHFEWDEFVRFRELCSINITEACLVVTPRWIIEMIGRLLSDIIQRVPIPWQDIDACVFVLTGVASRAPAGQDQVIPKLIELLPQLPYPTEGFKALLAPLRCEPLSLVLFTSGYLALNAGPCKEILRFLSMQHLPAIPGLQQGPDPDAKKYCEANAEDGDDCSAKDNCGSGFWHTLANVVSAVINLVSAGVSV
ncbi:unnamed protein product, partial [Polarella glacialis]